MVGTAITRLPTLVKRRPVNDSAYELVAAKIMIETAISECRDFLNRVFMVHPRFLVQGHIEETQSNLGVLRRLTKISERDDSSEMGETMR